MNNIKGSTSDRRKIFPDFWTHRCILGIRNIGNSNNKGKYMLLIFYNLNLFKR